MILPGKNYRGTGTAGPAVHVREVLFYFCQLEHPKPHIYVKYHLQFYSCAVYNVTRIYQLDPTLLPPFFVPPLFLCACSLFLARCTQTPNLTKKATRLAIIKCQLIANTYVLGRKETHFPHFFVTVVHLNAGQK